MRAQAAPGLCARQAVSWKIKDALSWWRGVSYPVYTAGVQNALVFYAFNRVAAALEPERNSRAYAMPTVFAAGAVAGAIQSLITAPVENIKIKCQVNDGKVSPTRELVRLVRTQGAASGLMRGLWVTSLRDVPSFGVYFVAYDAVRELLNPGCRETNSDGASAHLLAGGLAGSAAWLSIYPIDVAKTRIQSSPAAKADSLLDTLQAIRKEKKMTAGLTSCILRAFALNAVVFSVYEATLAALDL